MPPFGADAPLSPGGGKFKERINVSYLIAVVIVAIYTASVGCETGTKIIDGTGSTNYIDLIGDDPGEWVIPTDPVWGYHQYGWLSDRVYDAVLQVNQGSPILPTNMTQYTYNTYLGYSYSDSTIVTTVNLGN